MPKFGIIMPEMGTLKSTRLLGSARTTVAGKPAGDQSPRPERQTSLADALFSGTQLRVLGLLFGQPARSFFANELIGLTGSGSGAVQRELKRLADSRLVTVRRVGNQIHYQADPASALFAALHDIIIKTVGIAEPLRDALKPLARRITLAFVYGSVAKGADTATSDIDLLVVADDVALEALFAVLRPAEKRLGRSINPTLYTADEFRRRRKSGNAFLSKVLAGETLVLIGAVDGVA